MFQFLFKRAEVAIERTIGQLIVRVLVAVPFLFAAGFGLAALWIRLERAYGSEMAALIIAGAFLGIGLVAGIVAALGKERPKVAPAAARAEQAAAGAATSEPQGPPLSDADKELLKAALGTVAPMALPHVLRLVLRNLPLLAAIGAAAFIATRPVPDDSASEAAAQPAE